MQSAIRYYRAGDQVYYRVVALQMRLLLCDTVRRHNRVEDTSLLPRVLPGQTLPSVLSNGQPGSEGALTLSDWLQQPLSAADGSQIPIRDFIRRVCDQDGGAHVDPKPEAGLTGFPDRAEIIIHLAELVCSAMNDSHVHFRLS